MTRAEAVTEARRRWGPKASLRRVRPPVGRCGGSRYYVYRWERDAHGGGPVLAGFGATWADAFAHADQVAAVGAR